MFYPNKVINLLCKFVFLVIDFVWFRKDVTLWLIGVPHTDRFDGNVRALYERARQNPDTISPARIKVILPAGACPEIGPSDRIDWGSRTHFFALLRSGCIFFHHNYNDVGLVALPFWRTNIRVSHGIHFKCVERAISVPSLVNRLFLSTRKTIPHHFVSSKLDAMSAVAYFHVYLPGVTVTGAAKNDILIEDGLSEFYCDQERTLADRLSGRRLITYAPTWRTNGQSYAFDREETAMLDQFLSETNSVFGIAGHQYLQNRHVPSSDNFIDLNALGADIQVILRSTDVLISDYSSIWIDFLIKSKPIILFQYDHAEYLEDRGILFDMDVFSPQTKCYSFDDLLSALMSPLKEEDIFLRRAFHQFEDGNNGIRNLKAAKRLTGLK